MIILISDDDSQRRTFPYVYVNLLLTSLNILVYLYVYYLAHPQTQNDTASGQCTSLQPVYAS